MTALSPNEEANKQVVRAFYDALINRKDIDLALSFIGPRYIQHNPLWPDGTEGLRQLAAMLKKDFPQARSEFRLVLAEGDHVAAHVHSQRTPGTAGRAIVDIFRLEHGKIVEHWDVIQDIPASAANANGMF